MDSPTLNDSRRKFCNDRVQGRRQNAGTNISTGMFSGW
jgi:hypothetical protein